MLDSATRQPPAPTTLPGLVRIALQALRRVRQRRAQRLALSELMALDSSVLNDIGITRQDVIDALQAREAPVELLARRRLKNGWARR